MTEERSERALAKAGELDGTELAAVARAIARADGWTDWWDYLDAARAAIAALDQVRGSTPPSRKHKLAP